MVPDLRKAVTAGVPLEIEFVSVPETADLEVELETLDADLVRGVSPAGAAFRVALERPNGAKVAGAEKLGPKG